MSLAPSEPTQLAQIADVMGDPAASFWLRQSLRTALERDPVDALNDALVLASVLDAHLRSVLGLHED